MNKGEYINAMGKALAWRVKDHEFSVSFGSQDKSKRMVRTFKQLTVAIKFSTFCRELGLSTDLQKEY